MRIINTQANQCFNSLSSKPIVQLISGPVRAIAGIAQFVINGSIAIPSSIPTGMGWIKKDSPLHAKNLLRDSGFGLLHTSRGLLETIPFVGWFLNQGSAGSKMAYIDDHPYGFTCRNYDLHDHCSIACK